MITGLPSAGIPRTVPWNLDSSPVLLCFFFNTADLCTYQFFGVREPGMGAGHGIFSLLFKKKKKKANLSRNLPCQSPVHRYQQQALQE